jgi:GNAT superfamily N-acetyltransferase
MTPTPRAARPEEIDEVSELISRAYSTLEEGFPWPEAFDMYLANVADVRGRWGTSRLWVAEDDGRLVGTAEYFPPGAAGYYPDADVPDSWTALRGLAVDPEQRGSGLGTSLSEHVIGLARADGGTHMVLHSIPHMAAAIRIYESLGFERFPEADFAPAPGIDGSVLAFQLPL